MNVEITGYMHEIISVDGYNYDDYSVLGYGTTTEEGKPALPKLSVLLGIPATSDIEVSISNPTYEYIYNTTVHPKQRDLFEDEVSPGFMIDSLYYSSSTIFPENLAENSDPSIWRDVRVSTIYLYPFRFEPDKCKVSILKSFQVNVNYSGTSNTNPLTSAPKYIPDMFHNLYEQNIANYDFITIPERNRIPTDFDLLILINEDFMLEQGVSDEINRFLRHKKFMGLESKIVYVSDADNENTIKQKILDEMLNSFSHVIIVGHPNLVPTSNIAILDIDEGESSSSESWYVRESWTSLPFSILGRFFVDDCSELDNIITKTIDYELNASYDVNWVNNAVLMSGNGDGGGLSFSENIFLVSTTVTGLNYTILNGDVGETTIDNLSTELTNGTGLVLYRGHGGRGGLDADHEHLHFNDDITPESISGLNYNKRYPIFFNIACGTHACGPRCYGEPMYDENFGSGITNNSQIALASFGATSGSRRDDDNILSVSMVDAFANPLNNSIGEIILQGFSHYSEAANNYACINHYSLYVDPTLQVKVEEINKFNVSWNDNILYLKDKKGIDVSEAKVIFFDENQNIITSMITDTSGYLVIDDIGLLNSVSYLSFHKKNYNSKIVQVISESIVVENTEDLYFDLDVLLINGADVVINEGGSLALTDGVEVIFGNNSSEIMINGGVEFLNNNFTSQEDIHKPSIFFEKEGNYISDCNFENVNINISSGDLIINSITTLNSTIESYKSVFLVDSSIINGNILCEQTEFNLNQSSISGNSYGVKPVDSSFEITDSEISMNNDDGVVINNCYSGNIYRNEIKNSRICQNTGNGLEVLQSILKVKNTTIEDNNIGIVAIGSSLVSLSTDESNQIEDSRISNNRRQEIYQINECIEANQANYEVSDSYYSSYTADQLLVHTEDIPNGRHLQFTGNYWGYRNIHTIPILPPSSRFIPALINPSIGETGYDLSPVWGPAVNVTYSYSNDEQIYYSALNEVSLGNIDNSIDLFKQVIQNYPNSNYSVLSSKNLFKLVPDKAELKEFLFEEPNLYVGNVVHKDIDYLINHCDIELGNLQEASIWCENKISNPESEFDSLLAVIDLEYINLCLENESDSTKTNNLQLIHKRREKYVSFIDNKIDQLINISNISMINENQNDIAPITTRLYNNYPNPFNPETTISFDLPQRGRVELVVYNLRGQKVKSLINEEMDMGVHKIIWNGTNNQGKEVASGVYYYRLSCGNYTKTNKMVLMK